MLLLNHDLDGDFMIGARVEMLEIVEVLPKSRILCRCDCGNTREMRIGHFNAGYAKSCGCHWKVPKGLEVGATIRERTAYGNMMARCHNPKNKRFKDYGAVGIFVCEEWRSSVAQFLKDMGPCPDGFQIDRIDNSKGYSKTNCRWVSPKENMANRSISMNFVVHGISYQSSSDAALTYGVTTITINAWCKGRIAKGRYYPPKPNCYVEPVYGREKQFNQGV
jgi:hypothetical protein